MKNGLLKAILTGLFFAVLGIAQTAARPRLSHPMTIKNGVVKAMDVSSGASATSASAKLFIWADDGQTSSEKQIIIRGRGFADDANNLMVTINEQFTDFDGNVASSDSYPCDCGGGNSGYIPSLMNYNFITLISKKVPSGRIGFYQFTITVVKNPGDGGDPIPYQTTKIIIPSLFDRDSSSDPLHISQLQQVGGKNPELVLTGQFPVNTPLYYFVGAAPYSGGFSPTPLATSTDGTHLLLPGLKGSEMESRVILMTPDGSFSTTSAQAFTPLP